MNTLFAFIEPLRRRPSLALGLALVGLVFLLAIVPDTWLPSSPYAQDLYHTLQSPSLGHPFGTDAFGRDILSRVASGARLSLIEIVASISITCLAGIPLGMAAGFAGGLLDGAAMWVMDVLFAFPGLILAILAVSVLGEGLFNTILAISLFSLPVYARLSRNLTLELRGIGYVQAAGALGAGPVHILRHHILPAILPPLLLQATLTAGTVVLAAASLSFLGLGAQPPLAEWGAMMSDGRNYVGADLYPALFPGLAIALTVFGFDRLGEGVRDLLDPRSRLP